MKSKIDKSLTEAMLRKANYRIGKKINEATYNQIDLSEDEFDEVPKEEENPEMSNQEPENQEGAPPTPEFDETNPPMGDEELPPVEEPVPAEPDVDDIQNEIIKHNIEAMKGIHSQIENLNSLIQSLNSKYENLTADVEEVREPSTVEKMITRKEVSYPFYLDLNDFWGGNWYEIKQKEEQGGIRELPDGSFIADFDDLPKLSKLDVEKSFDF